MIGLESLELTLRTYLSTYTREVYLTYDQFTSIMHLKNREGQVILTLRGPTVLQAYEDYLRDVLRSAREWKDSMDMWTGRLEVCL